MSDSATAPVHSEAVPWQLPAMDEPACEEVEDVDLPPPPTAEEIAAWEEEARSRGHAEGRDAGYQEGLAQGRNDGRDEMASQRDRYVALIDSLEQPFAELDEQVEQELLQMVVSLAQQLVRREIRVEPGEIIGVIRESLELLPVTKRELSISLHPQDAELVRETFAAGDKELQFQLSEDPLITRGGCRIHTEVSQLDVTLESRLASRVISGSSLS